MKKIISTLFLATSIVSAAVISGTVLDEQGEPVEGATVQFGQDKDTTNTSGIFQVGQETVLKKNPLAVLQTHSFKNGKIQINLPSPETVQFRIFSMTGRQIAVFSGTLPAGAHSLILPGSENLGSGVYFFESHIGKEKQVAKFVAESGIQITSVRTESQPKVESRAIALTANELSISKSSYYDYRTVITSETDTTIGTIVLDPIGFGMKQISGGDFLFGDETGLGDATELPTVAKKMDSFHLDSVEVTIGEFARLRGFVPESLVGMNNRLPVTNVTWFDAILYANARSKEAGLDTVYTYKTLLLDGGQCLSMAELTALYGKNGYRLPTETEWEFVAKAGSSTLWSFGADMAKLSTSGWFMTNSNTTVHVGAQKLPAYGVYDLYGNVAEWVGDWYGTYSDKNSPMGSDAGTVRVVRGGSFADKGLACRSSVRSSAKPDSLSSMIGFRLAKGIITKNNHAPIIDGQQKISVNEDETIILTQDLFTISDEDGETQFTLNVESGTNYTFNGTTIVPAKDFNGNLVIPMTATDSSGAVSPVKNINITINAVNDAPVITENVPVSLYEDGSITLTPSMLTITDADKETVFTMSAADGANYKATGLLITPSANFNGELSVPVTVHDTATAVSNTYNLKVTVKPVNDVPEIIKTPSAGSVIPGRTLTESLIIVDVDNDPIQVTAVSPAGVPVVFDPVKGTITMTALPAIFTSMGKTTISLKIVSGVDVIPWNWDLNIESWNQWEKTTVSGLTSGKSTRIAAKDKSAFYTEQDLTNHMISKYHFGTSSPAETVAVTSVNTMYTGTSAQGFIVNGSNLIFSYSLVGSGAYDVRYSVHNADNLEVTDTYLDNAGVKNGSESILIPSTTGASHTLLYQKDTKVAVENKTVINITGSTTAPFYCAATSQDRTIQMAFDKSFLPFRKVGTGNWNELTRFDTGILQFSFASQNGDTAFAVGYDTLLYSTKNATGSLEFNRVSSVYQKISNVFMIDGKTGWVLTNDGVLLGTRDGFATTVPTTVPGETVRKIVNFTVSADYKSAFAIDDVNNIYRWWW